MTGLLETVPAPQGRVARYDHTIPVTTSATPMINIGRKSLSHPPGQLIKPDRLYVTA